MTPEETRDRKALYRDVQYERISPAEADAQLRQWGQEPFQSRPDPSRFDPMSETEWTLPMAAAWFIWRSPDAVRDQWNPARNGWQKWVRVPKRKNTGAGSKGPRWELKRIGSATLAEVFRQARLPGDAKTNKATALWSVASDHIHTPYSRLKEILQSGYLRATWGKHGAVDFDQIPPEYWRYKFEAIANPKKQPSSDRSGLVPVRSTVRALISRKSPEVLNQTVKLFPPDVPTIHPDELEDLPDLSLTDTSTSQTQQENHHNVVPYIENSEVFLRQEDVILAEQKTSQIEYEQPDWSLGQALGWVAYRRREAFRSLWETDISPRPDYYGENYSSGLVTDDPVSTLREALLSGKLVGRLRGEPLSSVEWLDLDVWSVRRMKFLRTDVIKVWAELPALLPPKKPLPSDEELTKLHEALDIKLGKTSTVDEFYKHLKGLGIAPVAEAVKSFQKAYLNRKGLKVQRGRRTFEEPRPNSKADSQ